MRIGIVPELDRAGGGIYQYSMTMVRALQDLGLPDEFLLFHTEDTKPPDGLVTDGRWRVVEMRPKRSLIGRVKHFVAARAGEGLTNKVWLLANRSRRGGDSDRSGGRGSSGGDSGYAWLDPVWVDFFEPFGLDFMIYPSHNRLSFEVGIPYVISIHDLQHRLQPEFPEVSVDAEIREHRVSNCIKHATLILADSDVGKQDILNLYGELGVTDDMVKVLPFLPAVEADAKVDADEKKRVRDKYKLPGRYLFYPAQFWPHKNHLRIVQALARLGDIDISLVLSGSHSGAIRDCTFKEVMRAAQELGVQDRIAYIGYAPDEDMPGLYSTSAGLIMPTFFGPTNIPILEAFGFGCPVITSDIRGIREQVDGAAVLVDPRSVDSIAEGMRRLLTELELADELIGRGHERLAAYTSDDYKRLLASIIGEAKRRVAGQPVTC